MNASVSNFVSRFSSRTTSPPQLFSIGRLYYLGRLWGGSHVTPVLLPANVKPLFASLKLTENCQAACVTCDYWKSRWKDHIGTKAAIDLINQLRDLGVKHLRFTGGEPLLRRDLFTVLNRANTSSFRRISIQTNGLLLKKLHRELNDSPITRVSVSIDGLEKENDAIRWVEGYFRLALEGISLLKGKQLQICVTLSRISIRQLPDLLQLVRDLGADFSFNILEDHLYFMKHSDVNDLWPEEADVVALSGELQQSLGRPRYEVEYIEQYFRRSTEILEPPCIMGFIDVIIASNGDVLSGCAVLPPIGNVLRERLSTIFASSEYRERSTAMVRRECPGCTRGLEVNLRFKHARPTLPDIKMLLAASTASEISRSES